MRLGVLDWLTRLMRRNAPAGEPAPLLAPRPRDLSRWSLAHLVAEWRPDDGWRSMVATGHDQIVSGANDEERADGWGMVACAFGDMHALAACTLVCLHARVRHPRRRGLFDAHLNLCFMEMGLAAGASSSGVGGPSAGDAGEQSAWRRDDGSIRRWIDELLASFDGDAERAAYACLRLGASRLGIICGPAPATMEQLADAALWQRVPG